MPLRWATIFNKIIPNGYNSKIITYICHEYRIWLGIKKQVNFFFLHSPFTIFVPVRGYFEQHNVGLYPCGAICISKVALKRNSIKLCTMNIGEYIRSKRKKYNLTQVELAERSGVGLRFVRELERGKTTVQMDKVNQVLYLFGEVLRPSKIEQL